MTEIIEDLELRQLVEDYLDAIRDGDATEFLEALDDEQREHLLAFFLNETGAR
jgi:hypothetical protein